MRTSKNVWRCIVCGSGAIDKVICYSCEMKEFEKQKSEAGSITESQLWFIENKTVDMVTIQEVVKNEYPEFVWQLHNLSTEQAKRLTKILLDIKNTREEKELDEIRNS